VPPREALPRQAAALARPGARAVTAGTCALTVDEAEVDRVLQICNACRYCEGFCAVFPAMTRRLEFGNADINYLANLCHNCGSCLHACQYAPPHEFAVNVPLAMARVRLETYSRYAWPPALGELYKRNGLTLAMALTGALVFFLLLAAATNGSLWGARESSFYAIFPHSLMVALFTPIFLFAVLALGIGVRRFWRDERPAPASRDAVGEAVRDALRLKYLDGGHRDGCNDEDDRFTQRRRLFHHLTFYGFLLCFAATSVATLYHYLLASPAPYDYRSLPKLLGIVGGIALVIGTGGLFWLNLRRHPLQQDAAQRPMDRGFIALLFVTAASGLVLMLVKDSAGLPVALCVHLGAVMALFATLPYGKFAHGIYRSAALLKWSIERRQPNKLQLAEE
jgi:citrate/tricarballylate utilization protein